jgi:uncharacterized membrane protein
MSFIPTQPIRTPRPQSDKERHDLTVLTHITYALHLASWASAGIFSVIALIINYIKRDDVPDAFFASHFRWQSRTFWFTILWLALTSPLYLLLFAPGVFAWTLIGFWYLYRYIKGWLWFSRGRPIGLAFQY